MWCHATLHYASIFCILPNWQRLNSLAGKTRMCLSCQWYRALELDCSRQLVHPPLLATFGQGAYPQATSWRLTNSVETELLYYFMNKFNEIYFVEDVEFTSCIYHKITLTHTCVCTNQRCCYPMLSCHQIDPLQLLLPSPRTSPKNIICRQINHYSQTLIKITYKARPKPKCFPTVQILTWSDVRSRKSTMQYSCF